MPAFYLNKSSKADRADAVPFRSFFAPPEASLNLEFRENQSQKVAISGLWEGSAWDSAQSPLEPGR
jgi:hypothetical protein